MVVKGEFEKIGLHPVSVALGEVVIEEESINKEQYARLSESLITVGFELIDDKKSKLIEQMKTFIIQSIHHSDEPPTKKYSQLLAEHTHHDYSYLSNLFSAVEGITVEQYILNQKIEKAKEMLTYDEQSLSQVAFQLGYSSIAHLSTQFKKLTGFTPTAFKKMRSQNRKSLDQVGKP